MNYRAKLTFLMGYFVSSAAILVCTGFFFGPWFHEAADGTLQWFDYPRMYFGGLLVPALYGLCSYFIWKQVQRGKQAGMGYFVFALILGLFFSALIWFNGALMHIDCGNDCIPSIPSTSATTVVTLLSLPPLILAPINGVVVFSRKD